MKAGELPSAVAILSPRAALLGARVLLVDDADVIRDVTRALLEDAGIVVEEAEDGAAAVAMMRGDNARCDLILMDVQMPVMDGMAATRMICAELGERAPPIIAVTAQVSEQEKRDCHDAGMRDHLAKPVVPDRLLAVLNRWLLPAARSGSAVEKPATTGAAAVSVEGATRPVLAEIPGFDLDAGLGCVGGKSALLHSMLVRFGRQYADVMAQLRQQIIATNFREARRVAHTLKGSAATLGGTLIAEAAGRLEHVLLPMVELVPGMPGVAGEQGDAALAELEAALQQALPALRAMAATQTASTPAPVVDVSAELPQSEAATYQALRELLAGNCYAARKAFAELRTRLGADDADWRAAATAVDALDFGQALARLDARYPANVHKL